MAKNIFLLDSEQLPVEYNDDERWSYFEIKLGFPEIPEVHQEVETEREEMAACQDSSKQIDNFIFNEKSKNTVAKIQSDWKRYEQFCTTRTNKNFNINNIPGKDLNMLLCFYFLDLRKKNGGEYEPDTPSSFHKDIQHQLCTNI